LESKISYFEHVPNNWVCASARVSNCPCAALIREPHEKRNELSSEKELRPTFSKLRWLATAAHIFYCFFVPSQSAVGVCARPPYKSDKKHPKNGDFSESKSQEKPENRRFWERVIRNGLTTFFVFLDFILAFFFIWSR